MTINLVSQLGPAAARALLERSFAQYQADRSVVGLVRGADRGRKLLAEITRDLGEDAEPILDYARLRAAITDKEKSQARSSRLQRRRAANDALAELGKGDIINITHGRRGGLAVVLEPARDPDDPRPLVLSEHAWAGRISTADYSGPAGAIGTMSLPKRVEHRQPRVRRDLASALRSAAKGLDAPSRRRGRGHVDADPDIDPELIRLRQRLRSHPAHEVGDREAKLRQAERYLRIERENAAVDRKIAAATNSLARTFDRILGLLTERGYVRAAGAEEVRVTDDGRLLARIYSEADLLVAECLRTGAWNGLNPAELAAMVSAVLFEPRGSDGPAAQPDPPTAGLRSTLAATRRLHGDLRREESRHRLEPSREPDAGFAPAVYRWATTGDLTAALMEFESSGGPMPAGDFVRWCRQVLDLLDQVRNAAPDPALRAAAKRAIADVRRGVVDVDAG